MGSGKWEVRRPSHSALRLNGQKSEIRISHFVKSEVSSLKSEVGSRKSEVGSRKSEVGSRKSEVGRPSSAFVGKENTTSELTVPAEAILYPLFDPNGYVSMNRVWFLVS